MKSIKTKGLTSLTLACVFTVVALSGIALYFTPKGRVANWTGWTLGGLTKHQWEAIHLNACFFVLAIVGFHLFYNWRVLWAYIRKRNTGLNLKLEMAVAVVATSLVVVGTIIEIPPFTQLTAMGEQIKQYWDRTASRGPTPHAEELPLGRFARSVGLWPEDVMTALRHDGLKVESPRLSVADLAKQNQMTPAQIYTAIVKHFPQATPKAAKDGAGQAWRDGRELGDAAIDGERNQRPGRDPKDDVSEFEHGRGGGLGLGRSQGPGMGRGGGWRRQQREEHKPINALSDSDIKDEEE